MRTRATVTRTAGALERRVDLDLVKGSHPDPTELAGLAERHPLRESLWVRVLRVLESAGRPAEALARYERIRRWLAEELGADPSAELQQVHADLLAGGALPDGRAVPRQLPAAVDGFAGREAELATLDALLGPPEEARSQPPLIAVIAGTAGVRKTTLAVHWAHRVADRFPDGQLYLGLRGYDPSGEAIPPTTAIGEFLNALHVPPYRIPDGPAAQAGLYRSLLARRRMLVLLDNARDADQVAPLLPGAPGCLVGLLVGITSPGWSRRMARIRSPSTCCRRTGPGGCCWPAGLARTGSPPSPLPPRRSSAAVGPPLALAIVAARAAIYPPRIPPTRSTPSWRPSTSPSPMPSAGAADSSRFPHSLRTRE